jgi:hypothetical protein
MEIGRGSCLSVVGVMEGQLTLLSVVAVPLTLSDIYPFFGDSRRDRFLTAHLTSRYPDLFTAAILRNPVTSFGENCTITDVRPSSLRPEIQAPCLRPY